MIQKNYPQHSSKFKTYPEEVYLLESLKSCCLRNGSRKQGFLAWKVEAWGKARVEKMW